MTYGAMIVYTENSGDHVCCFVYDSEKFTFEEAVTNMTFENEPISSFVRYHALEEYVNNIHNKLDK